MNKKLFDTKSLILCALFTALLAIGALIRIPIPPVPFTLQILFVMLAGLLLGSRRGAISVLIYIALGLIGVPVFAGGGGIGYVLVPTFGYIIGFAFGAFAIGKAVEKLRFTYLNLLFSCFVGMLIIYAIGMAYLYIVSNLIISSPIGIGALMVNGFLRSLPKDIAFCFICALLGKRLLPVINKRLH
jgi:biotin transport system substrate-specific component